MESQEKPALTNEQHLVGMAQVPAAALEAYRKLHEGLSDMVEGGRLSEVDIPDDYLWLVAQLERLAVLDPDGTDELSEPINAHQLRR